MWEGSFNRGTTVLVCSAVGFSVPQSAEEQAFLFFTGAADDIELPAPVQRERVRDEMSQLETEREGEEEEAEGDRERDSVEGVEEDEAEVGGEGEGYHSSPQVPEVHAYTIHYILHISC